MGRNRPKIPSRINLGDATRSMMATANCNTQRILIMKTNLAAFSVEGTTCSPRHLHILFIMMKKQGYQARNGLEPLYYLIFIIMFSRIKKQLTGLYYSEAINFYSLDRNEEAIRILSKAIRLDPKKMKCFQLLYTISLDSENYSLAFKCIKQVLKLGKISTHKAFILKSEVCYRRGHFKKAYRMLKEAQNLDSTPPILYLLQAKCMIGLRCYKRAISLLNKVSFEWQQSATCQYLKGVCCFYLGRYQTAVGYLNKAAFHQQLRYNPDLLFFKANSHYNLREFERAIISYEQLLVIDSSYQDALFPLSLARMKLGEANEHT